eukprot:1397244-Amphidinium_carterae.1
MPFPNPSCASKEGQSGAIHKMALFCGTSNQMTSNHNIGPQARFILCVLSWPHLRVGSIPCHQLPNHSCESMLVQLKVTSNAHVQGLAMSKGSPKTTAPNPCCLTAYTVFLETVQCRY